MGSINEIETEENFQKAVLAASETDRQLPPDILLSLYAHYKQATHNNHVIPYEKLAENDLRGAFKYNAMIQVRGLTTFEAKQEYIKLVNEYILG